MRTESSRIQGEIAISNYKKEGITEYEWVAEPSACDICAPLDGKRFKVKGADVGNDKHPLFPMHPNCRCAIVPVPMDREEYNAWLDHIDQGGTTEEWERQKKRSLGEKRQAGKLRRKARERDIIIKNAIDSCDVSTTINSNKQNRHIKGTKEYVEGRSYINGTLEDAQALVD